MLFRSNSRHLLNAARNGDAKAALAILQHAHGWVAKQSISVEVDQRISVLSALQAAEARVIEGSATPVLEQQAPQSNLVNKKLCLEVRDAA